jgi:hypothetical protein
MCFIFFLGSLPSDTYCFASDKNLINKNLSYKDSFSRFPIYK